MHKDAPENNKNGHIENIVSIFSNIDEKIQSLHECSSQDFLTLNKHLKEFHKRAKSVSEHLNKITSMLDNSRTSNIFEDLDNLPASMKLQMKAIEKNNKNNIAILEKIYKNLNLLWVPLKNFRQNLLTLKFLITNLKLNYSGFESSENKNIDNELEKLDFFIQEIKNIYPDIDKNLWDLKVNVKNRLFKLNDQRDKNLNALDSILSTLRSGISLFFVKHEKLVIQASKLSKDTEDSFRGIGRIITNLQYHDIIRQKMEHIQMAHKEIVKELLDLEKKNNQDALSKYISQIPEIAELQVAQLIYTNKEYQQAIENITKQFYDIAERVAANSSMAFHYQKHSSVDDKKLVGDNFERFSKGIELLENFNEENYKISVNVSNLERITSSIEGNMQKIFEIDSRLENVASNLLDKNSPDKGEANLSNTARQIHILCSEMHTNMRDLKLIFTQAIDLSEKLAIKNESKSFQDTFNTTNKTLKEQIISLEDSLTYNMDKIYNILLLNSEESEGLSKDIRNAIDGVNYYDFFDNVIDEIIMNLNQVFQTIKNEDIDVKEIEKSENLLKLRQRYTTMSEHLIHNRFMEGSSNLADFTIDVEQKEDELGDVELF